MAKSDFRESRQRGVIEAIKRKMKAEPTLMGEHIGIPSNVLPRSKNQDRIDWWTPDPDVLADPQTFLRQSAELAMATAKEGEPFEDTHLRATMIYANRLYPARLPLMRAGARGLSVKDQISFADEMSNLGPPDPEEDS